MEDQRKDNKIEFKDFLDQCTNLATLFGVFNALLIYSFTIQDSDSDQFLIPTFLILSIFVWYELILFTLKSSDGSRKYLIFFGLICSVQIGLILLFIKKFATVLFFLFSFLVFFGVIYILVIIFNWLFFNCLPKKWLQKLGEKKLEKSMYIIIFISIIIGGFVLKIISTYISHDSTAFTQEFLRRLSSKEYSVFPTK
jgi:hypothetical protein